MSGVQPSQHPPGAVVQLVKPAVTRVAVRVPSLRQAPYEPAGPFAFKSKSISPAQTPSRSFVLLIVRRSRSWAGVATRSVRGGNDLRRRRRGDHAQEFAERCSCSRTPARRARHGFDQQPGYTGDRQASSIPDQSAVVSTRARGRPHGQNESRQRDPLDQGPARRKVEKPGECSISARGMTRDVRRAAAPRHAVDADPGVAETGIGSVP